MTSFEDGNYTIEIYQTEEEETIHPIDPKYLPEGGVGYTENSRTFELTPSEENEQIMHYNSYQRELNLVEGKTYQVILNGVTYESVCYETAVGSVKVLMIGKFAPNESEPFRIYEHESYGTDITTINGETSITVSGVDVIHRIDNKYLVNDVNLAHYLNTDGVSLNNIYQQVMMTSVQSGGTLKSAEITMLNPSFRENCNSDNQLVLKLVADDEEFLIPVVVDRFSASEKVIQMSGSVIMGMDNVGVLDMKVLIWFKSDTTLTLYVKATPITV